MINININIKMEKEMKIMKPSTTHVFKQIKTLEINVKVEPNKSVDEVSYWHTSQGR